MKRSFWSVGRDSVGARWEVSRFNRRELFPARDRDLLEKKGVVPKDCKRRGIPEP